MVKIEEIKKRLAYLPRELKDGGFSDNSLAFGARLDIEYLLSIIEQKDAELNKAIAEIKFQVERNDRQREGYFKQEAIIAKAEHAFEEINYQFELHEHEVIDNAIKQVDGIATKALQAIRGN